MKTQKITISLALCTGLLIVACQSKPKIIESTPLASEGPAASFISPTELAGSDDPELEEHQVRIEETLDTEKYTYLNVSEDEQRFWIAIPRKEVQVGGSYFYKGGLLKKNFKSIEHDRVFDTVYLVSDIIPVHATATGQTKDMESEGPPVMVTLEKGSIKISEVLADPEKFKDKLVKVTGKCVKVNPMIMNRNWVHLQDDTGEAADLTITTSEEIQLGSVVSLEGTISLNKDFGAGYYYPVIMEGAVLK